MVEYNRLQLPLPINEWMTRALSYPGIVLLELSPEIAIDSTQLLPPFHKDPADHIIVATARVHNVPLITCDHKILAYPHVQLLP